MPDTPTNAPAINFGSLLPQANQTPNINPNFKLTPNTMSIGQFGTPAPASGGVKGVSQVPNPNYDPRKAFTGGMPTQLAAGNPGFNLPSSAILTPVPQSTGNAMSDQQTLINANAQRIEQAKQSAQAYAATLPPPPQPPNIDAGTSQNASALSQGNSYADLLNAIANNQNSYLQTAQKSQEEINAQNAYIQAVQNQQNFQLSLTGGELAQYGVGRPLALSTGRAAQLAFNNQLQAQNMQNAVAIAQMQLGYEQGSRQIRTQAAQNAMQNELGIAGLAKPTAVGNALVSPTGQVQNIGVQGIPNPSDITNLATAIFQNGGAPDFATAYAQAQQIYGAGGQGGQLSTMQQSSLQNNGSTVATMQPNNIMGYDLSSYASNPQYESLVANKIQSMPTQMTTPSQIQDYIDKNYPDSPITGQMIFNASSSAGVSTKVLTAILAQESQMATDGSAGSKMNNPGNYGNTDTAMAQGQPVGFASMQDGVNHVASWLAQHPAQQGQDIGNAVSNSDIVSQVKSQLPVGLQNGVRVGPGNIPYLDLSEVPDTLKQLAITRAGQLGIKAFTPDDAAGIQALSAISAALNQVTMLATHELMPANGGLGTAGNMIKNWWGGITGTNPRLVDFAQQKDQAIKAVTALAGGTGSGLRLNTGTIEAALSNFPTQNDSLETALEKIDKTRDLLNIQLATAFGNPAISNGIIQYDGHSYMPNDIVANSDGTLGRVGQDGNITPIPNPYQ